MLANVSKRTIDYYTSIGLLQANRSKSNYRIYETDALDDLKFIEDCKKLSLPLDTIRKKLEIKKGVSLDESIVLQRIDFIHHQIKQLNNELSDLISATQNLNREEKEAFYKKLLSESTCLLQSIKQLST
ncbi:transcriptional regulator [Heyndrickxia sporothermodurans]|nr:transcriptional regulator [Heyndrickxia sporothermodurans]